MTNRYSDDPFNAEDHSEIENDEVVERMTNELNRDMPTEQETGVAHVHHLLALAQVVGGSTRSPPPRSGAGRWG